MKNIMKIFILFIFVLSLFLECGFCQENRPKDAASNEAFAQDEKGHPKNVNGPLRSQDDIKKEIEQIEKEISELDKSRTRALKKHDINEVKSLFIKNQELHKKLSLKLKELETVTGEKAPYKKKKKMFF